MKKNLLYKIAKIISTLFVPPVLNVLLFTHGAFTFGNTSTEQLVIISTSVIFGLLLPIITFFTLYKMGKIKDLEASDPKDRTVPYIIGALFCLIAIAILSYTGAPEIFTKYWIGYFILSICITAINHFWKISAHAAGCAMVIGFFSLYSPIMVIISGIILSLILFARFYLKLHTISQLIAGSLLGWLISIIIQYSNLL